MGLMDKVKAAAQDIATEAKKATEQGKSKMEAMQLRKKMDDVAKQLGYLIYSERTKGSPSGADADRLVGEIAALEGQLAAAEASEATSAAPQMTPDPASYSAPQPDAGGPPPSETAEGRPQSPEPPGDTRA